MSAERRQFLCAALVAGMASITYASTPPDQTTFEPQYTENGELKIPSEFRKWVFVGSNLGLQYRSDAPEMTTLEAARAENMSFHNIYMNPEAYDYFIRTRTFPDPTVLVMESFAASTKEPKGILTEGFFNGAHVGLESAVKNSRRPDGIKTAWAYYIFTDVADPTQVRASAPAMPDRACESCHREHASIDNVWVQFYPPLRDAPK